MLSRPIPWSARPTCFLAARQGRGATCRLPASATDGSPSTPAAVRSSAASVASHRLPNDGFPFGWPPTEPSQVRGHLALIPRRPPPRRPLAAVDLPQPDRPGHPMSRNRVQSVVEFDPSGRPCGSGPLANDSAKASGFRPWLVGPSHMLPRERWHARPHPGCLRSPVPPRRRQALRLRAEAAGRSARRLWYRRLRPP